MILTDYRGSPDALIVPLLAWLREHQRVSRLRRARYLRIRATAHGAQIGFSGHAARIARIHQYGLRDHVAANGPKVRYPRRELLRFTDELRAKIRKLLIEHLSQ